jgi:hypothetical protein
VIGQCMQGSGVVIGQCRQCRGVVIGQHSRAVSLRLVNTAKAIGL